MPSLATAWSMPPPENTLVSLAGQNELQSCVVLAPRCAESGSSVHRTAARRKPDGPDGPNGVRRTGRRERIEARIGIGIGVGGGRRARPALRPEQEIEQALRGGGMPARPRRRPSPKTTDRNVCRKGGSGGRLNTIISIHAVRHPRRASVYSTPAGRKSCSLPRHGSGRRFEFAAGTRPRPTNSGWTLPGKGKRRLSADRAQIPNFPAISDPVHDWSVRARLT